MKHRRQARPVAFPLPTGDDYGTYIEHVDEYDGERKPTKCRDCKQSPVVIVYSEISEVVMGFCWPHAQLFYGEAAERHDRENAGYPPWNRLPFYLL